MTNKDLMPVNGNSTGLKRGNEDSSPAVRDMYEWMANWNRWFDSLSRNFFGSSLAMPSRWPELGAPGTRWGGFVPAVNVSDNENEYLVTAELPGMNEKDIDITVGKDVLTLRGEKKKETEEKGTGWQRVERSYGSFERTMPLPQQVDTDKIEASFRQGVLTIHLPKLPGTQAPVKRISVKTESGEADKSR
jgi:HSP20 family protein